MSMIEHLIVNGERTEASDRQTFDVYDPSSGDVLASVAKATKADRDHAVAAARAPPDSHARGGGHVDKGGCRSRCRGRARRARVEGVGRHGSRRARPNYVSNGGGASRP